MRQGGKSQSIAHSNAGLFSIEDVRFSLNKYASQSAVQGTETAAATAAEARIPAGKYDGANDDAKPGGTADDVTAHNNDELARAHDVAAVHASDTTAADDGTHGADSANNAATAAGMAD